MTGHLPRLALTALALASVLAAPAKAAYVFETPEFNDFSFDPVERQVASWSFSLASGETITSAVFESSFGNSVAQSSATGDVLLAGLVVAQCTGPGEPCWDGPGAPIRYEFAPGEFSRLIGDFDLIYRQLDCCAIRLGPSRLTIGTNLSEPPAVPEPATWGLLIVGLGALGSQQRWLRSRQAQKLSRPSRTGVPTIA